MSKFEDLQKAQAEALLASSGEEAADLIAQARPELKAKTADGGKAIHRVKAASDSAIPNVTGLDNLSEAGQKPDVQKFQCNCACPKASDVHISVENAVFASSAFAGISISVEQPIL